MNLSILNDADFDSVFDLMSSSFPKDEMRSREKQFLLLDKEEYQLWGVKDGNLLCGFFALWEFSDFIYIEHFAVAEHMRCSGFGGKMLDLLCSTAKKQIILESELPENELAARRINFYIRHGFYKNGYPYIQPPMEEGRSPIPLCIMSFNGEIDKARFENIKSTLYKKVYNKPPEI